MADCCLWGLARLPQGLTWLPQGCRFSVITLGHVILGVNSPLLDTLRDHEQVHVAQYERWGPFFIQAYLLSSAWQMGCGRCAYRDNYFEKRAYGAVGPSVAPVEPIHASPGPEPQNRARQGGSALAASASRPDTAPGVNEPTTSG